MKRGSSCNTHTAQTTRELCVMTIINYSIVIVVTGIIRTTTTVMMMMMMRRRAIMCSGSSPDAHTNSSSHTSIQRQEVNIQKENRINKEGFFGLKFVSNQQRGGAVSSPEDSKELKDQIRVV